METEGAEIAVQSEGSPTDQPTTNDSNIPGKNPSPRYAPLSKVYARDNDGLLYISVIRRQIYGPNYNTQVLMGMKSSAEADAAVAAATTPCWHYFVHFNQWGVNFDRWVQEDLIFPLEDAKVQEYADRLRKEHRTLQLEMQRALPRKKGKIKIDGMAFLQAWRLRWDRINDEMGFTESCSTTENPGGSNTTTSQPKPAAKPQSGRPKSQRALTLNKVALTKERQLHSLGLTSQGLSPSNAITIPSAFKRDLVEQWEMICQCGMLPMLPCKVTVRQALDHYVESKTSGVDATTLKQNAMNAATDEPSKTTDAHLQANSTATAPVADKNPCDISDQATSQLTPYQSVDETPPLDGNTKDVRNTATDEQAQQWLTMADGIARFFDEALPNRLLYREEKPLLDSFEDEFATRQFSETFGCGHLLRLFVQLPDILEEQLDDSQRKPIVAKMNDFVRYLHKNHGKLLTQRYCRPNAKRSASVPVTKKKKKRKKARPLSAGSKAPGETGGQKEDAETKESTGTREGMAAKTEKGADAMEVEEAEANGPEPGQLESPGAK